MQNTPLLPKGREFYWGALDHAFDSLILNKKGIIGQATHVNYLDWTGRSVMAYVWQDAKGYHAKAKVEPRETASYTHPYETAEVNSIEAGVEWAENYLRAQKASL